MTDTEILPWTVIARRDRPQQRWLIMNREMDNKKSVWVLKPHSGIPVAMPRSWMLRNCEARTQLKSTEDVRRCNK